MMDITSTILKLSDGTIIALGNVFPYDENEYWVVQTTHDLPVMSRFTLILEFTGSLTNGIVGYYKSTYNNEITGQTRYSIGAIKSE